MRMLTLGCVLMRQVGATFQSPCGASSRACDRSRDDAADQGVRMAQLAFERAQPSRQRRGLAGPNANLAKIAEQTRLAGDQRESAQGLPIGQREAARAREPGRA